MPKYKMSAGSEFETLSKAELDASLKQWMVDTAKGIRPVLIAAQGAADGAGAVSVGGATTLTGGALGPADGYWWAVTRLAVRIDGQPAAFSLYLNSVGPHSLVRDVNGSQGGYAAFGSTELMVPGTDNLIIQGSSVTAGSAVTVTGQAIEMPNSLLWKWLSGA